LGRGTAGEEFGTAVLAALSVTGTSVVDTVLPMLVNELGEVSEEVLLVLDDYQFATGDGCEESMGFFVDHLPENVHVVLATRADPPLHLGRLRARGELNEIRTERLAFSEREVALLLYGRLGLHVDLDEAESRAVNTVKTHVRSIFRKLGVTSLLEALERAREKALI
jgi:LuxR family transcriptional regulator, maltose regulon positive regulatory protein